MKPSQWFLVGVALFFVGVILSNMGYPTEGLGALLFCTGPIVVLLSSVRILRRISTKNRMREKMEIHEELTGNRILPPDKDANKDEPKTIGERWEESKIKDLRAEAKKQFADNKEAGKPAEEPENDLADELIKLAKLKDEGILSEEEFSAAKAKLLG